MLSWCDMNYIVYAVHFGLDLGFSEKVDDEDLGVFDWESEILGNSCQVDCIVDLAVHIKVNGNCIFMNSFREMSQEIVIFIFCLHVLQLDPCIFKVEIFIDQSQKSDQWIRIIRSSLGKEPWQSSKVEALIPWNWPGKEKTGSKVTKYHWVAQSDRGQSWVKR